MTAEHPYRVHSGGYVVIPNEVINDERLSMKARGILLYLLGRPPGWRFAAERIARVTPKEGREAILSGLKELSDAGYYRWTRVRVGGGRFAVVTEVAVLPSLMPPPPTSLDGFPATPGSDQPIPAGPASVDPEPADPSPMSVPEVVTTESQTPPAPSEQSSPPKRPAAVPKPPAGFDAWWALYPRKVAKAAAVKAYVKAVRQVEPEVLFAATARFRDDPTREDAFTPHPASWLNDGRWEDEGPVRPPEPRRTSAIDERHAMLARQAERARLAETGGYVNPFAPTSQPALEAAP